MNHIIENEVIKVEISEMGAELMSIKSKADGTEYLWQGNPEFWGGRAYNLFPICGRLTEGKYTYAGKTYEMNLHGFVRKSQLTAKPIDSKSIEFSICDNEKTLAMYPFAFVYTICYALDGGKIAMTVTVENKDTKEMYFALGGHPGFNVPLGEGQFEDYRLEFAPACQPKAIYMSDTCYVTAREDDFKLRCSKSLALKHDLFDRDAILLKDIAHSISIKSSKSKKSVTVEFPEDMKYVGIWHAPKKEAPYVCIEPWTSVPANDGVIDELTTKRDMFKLQPNNKKVLEWSITVK